MTSALPRGSHVALSEAVSWIAFGTAFDKQALKAHVMSQLGQHSYSAAIQDIEQATEALAKAAHGGKVRLEGVYITNSAGIESRARNAAIEAQRLRDYRRFDINVDGLRFGQGLAWFPDSTGTWKYRADKRPDYFASILVKRSDLLQRFAPSAGRAAGTSKASLPRLPEAELQNWWQNLSAADQLLPFDRLWNLCGRANPGKHVARSRIRALAPGRRSGRRTNQPQKPAD